MPDSETIRALKALRARYVEAKTASHLEYATLYNATMRVPSKARAPDAWPNLCVIGSHISDLGDSIEGIDTLIEQIETGWLN